MISLLSQSRVRHAIELLRAEPARAWTIGKLAAACRIPPRTLQRHFLRSVGEAPLAYLRRIRLDATHRQLLSAEPQDGVTIIATRCGFTHLGRFAQWYRKRFGESPRATLLRSRAAIGTGPRQLRPLSLALERPVVAVLPFILMGPHAQRLAGMHEHIAATLCCLRWCRVTSRFEHAQYHLRGKVQADNRGQLRSTVALLDAATGRYLWADCWGGGEDIFEFEDRIAQRVAQFLPRLLRDSEIERALQKDPSRLTAWELTMRALPNALSVEPTALGTALEWLDRAIEVAPHDPLPVSLAAWCHAVRASHHGAPRPQAERQEALSLAGRARALANNDPVAEAMLAAAYTLSHDLDTAELHAGQALGLDGGSAWAWGRSAWIHAYRGNSAEAIERFQIALALAPTDQLTYQWSLGIASAHFEAERYDEAIRWSRRALFEQPKAVTINRLLAPAYEFAGAQDAARRSLRDLTSGLPDLTIAQVIAALPLTRTHLARRAEGLESLGMPVR